MNNLSGAKIPNIYYMEEFNNIKLLNIAYLEFSNNQEIQLSNLLLKPIFRLYRTLFSPKNNILTLVFVIPNVIPN